MRVLVVDDSVVVRQVLCDALKSDPAIEVVGTAGNGRVALEKIELLKPDVITLDLEMPEMDGLQTLDALRSRTPRIPVVVFSTLTERGALATLEALGRGASDYVCKPSGQRNVKATIECIRVELLPKLHAVVQRARRGVPHARPAVSQPRFHPAPPADTQASVIVIGISTGGPSALSEIIPKLPSDLRQPVLIVQHMPKLFTRVLAERLASQSALRVREASHRIPVEPMSVYIAPGGQHMRIAGNAREPWIALDQGPPENGCRPSADPLFESAVATFGSGVLALVLTGLGHDGTRGAGLVRRAGGQVWAQNEASAAAFGMPGSVIHAGLATRVLALSEFAAALADAARGFMPRALSARAKP